MDNETRWVPQIFGRWLMLFGVLTVGCGQEASSYPMEGCTAKENFAIRDVGDTYSTIMRTSCIESQVNSQFDNAAEVARRADENFWATLGWSPKNGTRGELVGSAIHCNSGVSLGILECNVRSSAGQCVDYLYVVVGMASIGQ